MRVKKIAFLAVCLLAAAVSTVYAHPPSDITVTFGPGTKLLKAVITHNVNNPQSHYIKKVDISLNGKEIIAQQISGQDNNNNQTVIYYIPDAEAGDSLSVEAYCSISGKLKKEIIVGND